MNLARIQISVSFNLRTDFYRHYYRQLQIDAEFFGENFIGCPASRLLASFL